MCGKICLAPVEVRWRTPSAGPRGTPEGQGNGPPYVGPSLALLLLLLLLLAPPRTPPPPPEPCLGGLRPTVSWGVVGIQNRGVGSPVVEGLSPDISESNICICTYQSATPKGQRCAQHRSDDADDGDIMLHVCRPLVEGCSFMSGCLC